MGRLGQVCYEEQDLCFLEEKIIIELKKLQKKRDINFRNSSCSRIITIESFAVYF